MVAGMMAAGRRGAVIGAFGFWAFSYVLFSARAALRGTNPLASADIRFAATVAGALIVWLFLARGSRLFAARPAIVRVVATTVLGAGVVLAARLLFSALTGDETHSMGENLLWVLVWTGYCGMALSLFTLSQRPAARIAAARPVADPDSVDWLIDAIADEIGSTPDAVGDRILARVQARAGYRVADPDLPGAAAQNRRVELVERVAAGYARS